MSLISVRHWRHPRADWMTSLSSCTSNSKSIGTAPLSITTGLHATLFTATFQRKQAAWVIMSGAELFKKGTTFLINLSWSILLFTSLSIVMFLSPARQACIKFSLPQSRFSSYIVTIPISNNLNLMCEEPLILVSSTMHAIAWYLTFRVLSLTRENTASTTPFSWRTEWSSSSMFDWHKFLIHPQDQVLVREELLLKFLKHISTIPLSISSNAVSWKEQRFVQSIVPSSTHLESLDVINLSTIGISFFILPEFKEYLFLQKKKLKGKIQKGTFSLTATYLRSLIILKTSSMLNIW